MNYVWYMRSWSYQFKKFCVLQHKEIFALTIMNLIQITNAKENYSCLFLQPVITNKHSVWVKY